MEPRRSSNAHPQPAAPSMSSSSSNFGTRPGGTSGVLTTVLVVLLIITSVIGSAYLINRLRSANTAGGSVKSKQYQALFLTNGQVYFGHLTNINGSYVELTDIYYLQVQQSVQPGSSSSSNSNQQVSLAKLGNELHGPEDEMFVAQNQVLFWENLKNSGKVVQAITSYQNSHKSSS